MKRVFAMTLVTLAIFATAFAGSNSTATASSSNRHAALTVPRTVVTFDGAPGEISVKLAKIRVGPDVTVQLRRSGGTDIDVIHRGQVRPALVLWYPGGKDASVTTGRNSVRIDVTESANTPPSSTSPGTAPPAVPSPTVPSPTVPSATVPMDHGSMPHGTPPTITVPAQPAPNQSGPVTPYVTPAKAATSARSDIGFSVSCDWNHSANDDPIVFPGQPGRSHFHEFFGSTATNAFTTVSDLQASTTTCTTSDDKSAYWAPALFVNGQRSEPTNTTFYYKPGVADRSAIQPIPLGLEMIAGSAMATEMQDPLHVWFQEFGNASNNTSSGQMITANTSGRITLRVAYPDCWDGVRLSSPDQSHVVYHTNKRECPATNPVAIPQLMMFVTYNTNGNGVSLASGQWFTMHADFFNAWNPETQKRLIDECIVPSVRCGVVYDAGSNRIPRALR